MQKKFIIFIIIIILIIIAGGIFWWLGDMIFTRTVYNPNIGVPSNVVRYPSEKEFVIEDTSEGKIMKDEKASLEVKVPEDWKVEKVNVGWDYSLGTSTDDWIVNLTSPDAKFDEKYHLIEGCGISIIVEYYKEDFEELSRFIKFVKILSIFRPKAFKEIKENEKIELLKVSNHSAVKEIYYENQFGKDIVVKIPVDNKIIAFETLLNLRDGDRCSQIFDDFLQTAVLIK